MMQHNSQPPLICIVGGGFGGMYSYRRLRALLGSNRANIRLFSPSANFVFTPLLHELSVNKLTVDDVTEGISRLVLEEDFVNEKVTKVDLQNKKLFTESETYNYDYLVLATGSKTNYWDVPGAAAHGRALKDERSAYSLRQDLEDLAAGPDDHCVIVGGGPTGVELAGEIAAKYPDISVTILNAADRLLPLFPTNQSQKARKRLQSKGVEVHNSTQVQEVGKSFVKTESKKFSSTLTIWAAGVSPNLPLFVGTEPEAYQGRLVVNSFLQIGKSEYAIGDVSVPRIGKSIVVVPRLAQVAVKEADLVARNIAAQVKGKRLKEYLPSVKGQLISLGPWDAIGEVYSIPVSGVVAWFIWRAVYSFKFVSLRKKAASTTKWIFNLVTPAKDIYDDGKYPA